MSSYTTITRHPIKGVYQQANWFDDHFGPHLYGVKFPHDDVIYPADQVRRAELKTFGAADVMEAFKKWVGAESGLSTAEETLLLDFLTILNEEYKERWKRDPIGGEGAVKWVREMRGDDER